jgi:arylsulfatase A
MRTAERLSPNQRQTDFHGTFLTRIARLIVITASLATLIMLDQQADGADTKTRPNVLLILADDLGYGDVGAYNPQSKIPTPHLDQLARDGMRFTDAHSSSSVCTPTRYSLLTGRYHWRTVLQSGVLGGFSRPLIAPDRLTLAEFFRRQGYHTACFGKWHLGMDWPLKNGSVADDRGNFGQPFKDVSQIDYEAPIQNGPVDRGFDHYFGISASLDMFPYVWIQDRLPTEVATVEKAFFRPGPAGAQFEAIDVQSELIERTIRYVGERVKADQQQPFFAYLPLAAPHTPILPTAPWQGSSGINPYADFVRQVDADLGRLMAALDKHGIADQTIVIFTSDNGCSPAANIQQLQRAGHEPSYFYRGHKADIYEGGHRIPFLVRWPNRVQAGAVSNQLIGQLDCLATFAELLGVTLSPTAGEDSVSFLATLLGNARGAGRTSLISQSINGSFAIRDGAWKLALCPGSGGWSTPRPGRDDTSRLPPVQLFHLDRDPGEQMNLVEQNPQRVAAMQATLEETIARGRSTPGPDQKNDARIMMIKPIPRVAQDKK